MLGGRGDDLRHVLVGNFERRCVSPLSRAEIGSHNNHVALKRQELTDGNH
jgi:hypothetical protein